MKILISGASGLIGSALCEQFKKQGHEVLRLVRRPARQPLEIQWNPQSGELATSAVEAMDVVIHLAGESVAGGRWTAEKKRRIRESRVLGTQLLCSKLAETQQPPSLYLAASAIGVYGNRGNEVIDESSEFGTGFLAEVGKEWEQAASVLPEDQCRKVFMRLGIVLTPKGAALKQMLPLFKLGLAGKLGHGQQYMSWISLEDVVGAVEFCLQNASLQGAVNFTSPHPVTNVEFTQTLGKVLKRPTFLTAPAPALRLVLGTMADEMLLGGAKVMPEKLLQAGYRFQHPDLLPFLQSTLSC